MAVDLSITNISISSNWTTTFAGGGELRFEINVLNSGDDPATDTRTFYYVSEDDVLDAGDTLVSEEYLSPISAGNTRSDSFTIRPSEAIVQGDYYLFAVVDGENKIMESDETNNASEGVQFTINNNPALYGDLQLDSVVYDYSNFESDGEIGYTIDYTNIGNVAIVGSAGVRVGDGTFGSNRSNSNNFGEVEAGESGTYSGTISLSDSYLGDTFYITAYLFGENEQNRSNNEAEPEQYVDQGSVNDPYDQGVFVGWYYDVEVIEMEMSTFAVGWYNGWHLESGWHVGWNVGWYLDDGAWTLGWNVGWTNGWYYESGWYYGWGEVSYTTYHAQLGDLMFADGTGAGGWGWSPNSYYGWSNTGLGVGIGQTNGGWGYQGGISIRGSELTSVSTGWHFDFGWSVGWNMGWYLDAMGAWAMGWNVGWYYGWYEDFGAFATFNINTESEWLGGYGGWGWIS
ncbi:MAG: CARDB domain-containing protein [Pseudomonadota bacterium]